MVLWLGRGQAQTQNNEEKKVTVPESMLTEDQKAQLRSKNIRTDVHEWAGGAALFTVILCTIFSY